MPHPPTRPPINEPADDGPRPDPAPGRGIAWAGAVNLAGGAIGSVVGLVLAAVVARGLGTEGAGTYFLVVAVFTIVSNVAELGADTGLVRFVSAARATGRLDGVPHLVRVAVAPVLVVGLVVVLATAIAAACTHHTLLGLPDRLVVGASALAVLSSLLAVVLSITRGLGDVLTFPLLQNIGLPLSRLLAVGVTVAVGGGILAVVTAWMLPVALVLVLAALTALRLMRRAASRGDTAPEPTDTRAFWTFSATRGFSAAVEILLEWTDVLLVGVLTSAEAAGVYAVVTRCARASEVVQTAARIAVGPHVAGALARGAVHEAGQLYGVVSAAMVWLSWPFFLVLAIFGDVVLSVFGDGFGSGATALAVLSLSMAVAIAAGTVQTILLMGGRSSWQLADKSGALVLNVALDLALIPLWGITGAAVAWGITIVVDTLVVVFQVQRLMGVRPADGGRHVLTAATTALAVVGTILLGVRLLWGSSPTALVTAVVLAGATYAAASWMLRERLGLVALEGIRPT